ncbi:MAG TPA: hypothetical protein DCX54_03810 [Flavobacteriales bacterium]|nr:hypothetical protein [Flavobacteriales bacterium]
MTVSGFVFSQEAPLKFTEKVQKFGKVDEGKDVVLKYTFMNEGQEPILINEAKVNCTCTVVDYPEAPVSPNKVGQVTVTFHTESKIGYQERKIQLVTNLGTSEIVFKGVVKASQETKKEYKSNQ